MRFLYIALLGAASFLLAEVPASASDFDKAVGFALSGKDGTLVQSVNNKQCVFRVGDDTFYLNNINLNRTKIGLWKQVIATVERYYTTVELHGEDVILEKFEPAIAVDETTKELKEFHELMRVTRPELYKPSRSKHNSFTLTFSTTEVERLKHAWDYVYKNGCKGSPSSF